MRKLNKIKNRYIVLVLVFCSVIFTSAFEYSKAGFLEVPNSGRKVYNFNVGWRFIKGDVKGAYQVNFEDSRWHIVNCPHGLELLPAEASGGKNYQGPAWYRKHFSPPNELKQKQVKLHFEAVMGKSKVWLNGELVAQHFGGYLPFSVDLTGKLNFGEENVIAVRADNSDDPNYPPGKPQASLDFTYFGGIYRDVWLVSTESVFVTNPNDENEVAGGGLFVHYENLSEKKVDVVVKTHVRNVTNIKKNVRIKYRLKNNKENIVAHKTYQNNIEKNNGHSIIEKLTVKNPELWSPQSPTLYRLEVVIEGDDKIYDGVAQRIGIRKIEMRGKDGLWLNNKPYQGKLMGSNRHQDFAYVGNALPNNGQMRDAKILKKAGCDIIRAAHYPLDPAFMEACDALGMFCIVATPGWQFWNDKAKFEQRVYSDIRNMVRRDRNHPSVIMWEPILNETWYPEHFAGRVHNIVHDEYPYQGAYTVSDSHAKGQEVFDVIYSHPYKSDFYQNNYENTKRNREKLQIDYQKEDRCIFTREWGDCVDDWSSHNSPSRVARDWGEQAQLVQMQHYANPDYVYTCWETLHQTPKQHIGGALWHSFDHQRGYHPDPFYGGLTDVFRQPKYSYYLFASQKNVKSEPMIYIAHEMTPFSESDVKVLTNCDKVRLTIYERDTLVAYPDQKKIEMPHPIVTFEDVYEFLDVKTLHRDGKADQASLIAEGIIDGQVVARHKKMPAKRPSKINLSMKNQEIPIVANGSDFVVITASITDQDGNIKRLNNSTIRFEIEGQGVLIGNQTNQGNPRKIAWGNAPILVRSTTKAGEIKIKAQLLNEGINTPAADELIIKSVPYSAEMIYSEEGKIYYEGNNVLNHEKSESELKQKVQQLEKELNKLRMKDVERQQEEFEGE